MYPIISLFKKKEIVAYLLVIYGKFGLLEPQIFSSLFPSGTTISFVCFIFTLRIGIPWKAFLLEEGGKPILKVQTRFPILYPRNWFNNFLFTSVSLVNACNYNPAISSLCCALSSLAQASDKNSSKPIIEKPNPERNQPFQRQLSKAKSITQILTEPTRNQ